MRVCVVAITLQSVMSFRSPCYNQLAVIYSCQGYRLCIIVGSRLSSVHLCDDEIIIDLCQIDSVVDAKTRRDVLVLLLGSLLG